MQQQQVQFASNAAAVRATAGRKISIANSKMPGSSFATDPFACAVGSKLAEVEGSVCSKCYARRLAKMRPSVAKGYAMNEETLRNVAKVGGKARELFVKGMAHQIRTAAAKTGENYHRWYDAGDLANADVLAVIVDICLETPLINHWLPTRELRIVRKYIKQGGCIPHNLVLRVSSTMVGDKPRAGEWNTSTVHVKGATPVGHECPASKQGNNCRDCRACWDESVVNVSYPKH